MPNPFALVFNPLGFVVALLGHLVGGAGSRARLAPDRFGRQGAAVPVPSRA